MQISKLFLIACVGMTAQAVSWGADTEAQRKAREAMREKLQEVQAPAEPAKSKEPARIRKAREAVRQTMTETQPQPAPAPAAQAAKPSPAPESKPTAAPAPPVKVAQPRPVPPQQAQTARTAKPEKRDTSAVLVLPPSASPEAIAKAREIVRQKMNEMAAQQPVEPPAPVASAATAPAAVTPSAPAKAATVAVTSAPPAPVVPAQDDHFAPVPAAKPFGDIEKAREAVRAKANELEAQKPAAVVVEAKAVEKPTAPKQAAVKAPAPETAKAPPTPAQAKPVLKKAPHFEAIQGPASPLPEAKQQRLQALLAKYKADEISPDQYHTERARILAEP